MGIRIYGKCPYLSKEELRFAFHWMLREITGPARARRVQVSFSWKDPRTPEDGKEIATTMTYMGRKPRKFWVIINPTLRRGLQLDVLAHELIHVDQFSREDMLDFEEGGQQIRYWKGKADPEWDDVGPGYWDKPWEKEAYKKGPIICRAYRKYLREHQLSFPAACTRRS